MCSEIFAYICLDSSSNTFTDTLWGASNSLLEIGTNLEFACFEMRANTLMINHNSNIVSAFPGVSKKRKSSHDKSTATARRKGNPQLYGETKKELEM